MTDQPSNPAAIEPQAPHADGGNTDFETEAEHNADVQAPTDNVAMTSGIPAPPSPLLDTEDGNSDWDHEGFVAPTLEEMPTEGPGSPGFDIYAPENAKYLNPEPVDEGDHDDEDVKAALEAETADGAGDTPEDQLPESDVPAGEELADEYPDLEPRGDDLDDKKDNA